MGKAPPVRAVDGHLLASVGLVMVIAALDWMTPAGVVVGIFLCVPILLASGSSQRRDVWITLGVSVVAFVIAAILGKGPISPAAVWVPNRVIVLLALPASGVLASTLQGRRLMAEQHRDEAMAGSELNRLLLSLLAHDLRSPLVLSGQLFEYVADSLESGAEVDLELLQDVRARIARNLRGIEAVLAATSGALNGRGADEGGAAGVGVPAAEEIAGEVASFAREAELRGKSVVADVEAAQGIRVVMDGLALRQVLAILVDNAVRYALPGEIRVTAGPQDGWLRVRVADQGARPRLSDGDGDGVGGRGEPAGSGLGLELCRLLLERAGGRLDPPARGEAGTTVDAWIPAV